MLNEKQIHDNWTRFRELVNTEFSGERKDRLNEMYDHFEERMVLTPAAGKEHFHNAFPGGYVDHVLRVINLAQKEAELWEQNGAMINFTREELIFSAMHHDLAKVGNLEHDYYVPNDSQWHREKQGTIYKFNEDLINMPSWMRTFFLLQHFGIKMTEFEMIAIQCTDGLYSADTETILKQHEAAKQLRTNLPIIMHHADMLASRIEYDRWFASKKLTNPLNVSRKDEDPVMFKKQNINKMSKIVEKGANENQQRIFEDLFK